jgi:preprotein translocase subunit SecD
MQGFLQMPQVQAAQQAREEDRTFRQQEAQAARDARAEELQMRMQDQRASQAEKLQAQRELQQMQIDARKDMQRMIAASRPAAQAPNAQTLQTENGILERRGNEWVPITVGGKPVMPKGTGANAVLPEVAKAKDATDAMALLQQAAPLVRGATGSGIGAGVDWLAGQVGKATSGAENIAQLKTIAGMLVSKMPKMTGPQSDKDVMLYKEMAGNIGDPSVPTPLKEKAMQTIMEIQARYANTPAPTLDFTGAPQKQANPQDSQAMEWARSNPNDPRAKAIMQRLGGQ